MKKIFIVIFLSFVILGCSKKSDPLLLGPSSGTTSVTARCTQVDNSRFPENRAFVIILDQNNNPITNFALGNFSVAENGKPEVVINVKAVNNAADPLSAVLVIDQSGSMEISIGGGKDRLDAAKEAAIAFVSALGASDQAEIILFSSTIEVKQSFTSDKNLLIDAINSATPTAATAAYDAIARGITDLVGRVGRKVVVGLTDGADNSSSSYATSDALVTYANSYGVPVYTVGIVSGGSDADPAALKNIADNTGGMYFSDSQGTLTQAFQQILTQINNQVQVEFKSLVGEKPRTLKVYLNYGSLTTNCTKIYSY